MATDICDPPNSRVFVVCGKAVEEGLLREAFLPYGAVQSVRVIREKGGAYHHALELCSRILRACVRRPVAHTPRTRPPMPAARGHQRCGAAGPGHASFIPTTTVLDSP